MIHTATVDQRWILEPWDQTNMLQHQWEGETMNICEALSLVWINRKTDPGKKSLTIFISLSKLYGSLIPHCWCFTGKIDLLKFTQKKTINHLICTSRVFARWALLGLSLCLLRTTLSWTCDLHTPSSLWTTPCTGRTLRTLVFTSVWMEKTARASSAASRSVKKAGGEKDAST